MFRTNFRNALTIASLLFVVACAATVIDLPSITESSDAERAPGKVIWHDLLTHDADASREFYETLFGWEFEAIGSSTGLGDNDTYSLIRHNGHLIGGMIDTVKLNGSDDISQWVTVMSVTDIDSATRTFVDNGGQIVTPPTDLNRRGVMAVVRDPEGALLGLLQTRDGDPTDRESEVGEFLWDELWTSNVELAADFYADLNGLSVDTLGGTDETSGYRILKSRDRARVGIMENPLEGLDPVWVNYLRVEDPAAIAAQVKGLGGRVIVEAQPRPQGGEVAFVAGPSGAGIALQTWPLEPTQENEE